MESEIEWLSGKLSFNNTSNTYLCTLNKSLNWGPVDLFWATITIFKTHLLVYKEVLPSNRITYQLCNAIILKWEINFRFWINSKQSYPMGKIFGKEINQRIGKENKMNFLGKQ